MPKYIYDVFISYSSKDRPWAKKLADSLTQNNKNVFLDDDRLTAGAKWEQQLLEALRESQNMVVIWSDNARASDWVSQEKIRFQILRERAGENSATQKLIFLNLQGDNDSAYSTYQQINSLKEQNVYLANQEDKGINALDDSQWQKIIDTILEAINQSFLRVPVAILTLTEAEMD